MTTYADYSAARLTGNALRSAGFAGALRYAGTPGRTKNTTAAEVASLRAAGLVVHGVFENRTTDFLGGYHAGVLNAQALLADANVCGINGFLAMSADQHLTGAQQSSWSAYLQGARSVLGARLGAYGFKEAILVAKAIGAPYLWQCGSRSDLVAGVHFYQRNTGTTTVSGIAVDINDVVTPITEDELTSLDDSFQPTDGSGAYAGGTITYGYALQQVYEAIFYGGSSTGGTGLFAHIDAVPEAVSTAVGTVALSDAQLSTLLSTVGAAVSSAVGVLNVSVSAADKAAIATAVAAELAARLTA